MAIHHFPSNAESDGRPFILFTTVTARYSLSAAEVKQTQDSDSVVLYFPASFNVSDTLNYVSESTGLAGAGTEMVMKMFQGQETGMTMQGVMDIATGAATNKEIATAAGGIAGIQKGLLGAVGAGGVVGNAAAEFSKTTQKALNPREFMLFKSPGIRTFPFTFNLIPSNRNEVEVIPEIIKFFRKAAYPELNQSSTVYNFPRAFNINFKNSDKIIKIPQVFCTGVNVTYNPNTMSYFQLNNLPVEISLGLTFQELEPIHKGLIDQGY